MRAGFLLLLACLPAFAAVDAGFHAMRVKTLKRHAELLTAVLAKDGVEQSARQSFADQLAELPSDDPLGLAAWCATAERYVTSRFTTPTIGGAEEEVWQQGRYDWLDSGEGQLTPDVQRRMLAGEIELPAKVAAFYHLKQPELLRYHRQAEQDRLQMTARLRDGSVPLGVRLDFYELDVDGVIERFRLPTTQELAAVLRRPGGLAVVDSAGKETLYPYQATPKAAAPKPAPASLDRAARKKQLEEEMGGLTSESIEALITKDRMYLVKSGQKRIQTATELVGLAETPVERAKWLVSRAYYRDFFQIRPNADSDDVRAARKLAFEDVDEALSLDPKSVDARLQRAALLCDGKCPESDLALALDELDRAGHLGRHGHCRFLAGKILQENGRLAAARAAFEEVLRLEAPSEDRYAARYALDHMPR